MTDAAATSHLRQLWRRLRRDRLALAALALIAVLLLVAAAAPLVARLLGVPGPEVQNLAALDSFGTPVGPSADHPLGVDTLGRDVLSRIVHGARISLAVAILSTALSMTMGVIAGMTAGYFGGWVDTLLSRLIDVLLAFPIMLLALGMGATCSLGPGCLGGAIRPGLGTVIFVIAFVNWTYVARIIRGQVLALRDQEFIVAARAAGASNAHILFREILPNLIAPIIVCCTLLIPQNILIEAALSFLGVGVQPPTASWGAMIAEATTIFDSAWWYMVFPGATLVLTVVAFNLLGDGVQAALDPRASTPLRHDKLLTRRLGGTP